MEPRLLKNLDLPLLLAVVAASIAGCVMIASAGSHDPRFAALAGRQALWIGIGLALAGVLTWADYQLLSRLSRWLYLGNLVLLGLVLVFGHSIGGAQRWINLGPFRLQPSEFAKVLVVLTLATLLHGNREAKSRASVVLKSLLHISVPLALIACQPDLGTGMVLLAAWLGMLWIWGIKGRQLAVVVLAGLLLATGAWRFGLIRDYQKARFAAFLHPERDPGGAGYQLIQSQIALGAGGLWGAGLGRGTQNQLGFIPTQTTDFIFTIAGEESGFVGSIALLALYLFIVWRALIIAAETEDPLGALIAVGIIAFLAFQVFINIGMTMRLCPVSGLPLPFISYGGSSMLCSFIGVGLLQSVSVRRRAIQF